MTVGILPVWVIYGPNQVEYPGRYVLRRQVAKSDGSVQLDPEPTYVGPSFEAARLALPPDLVCLPRFEGDDPSIIETWF